MNAKLSKESDDRQGKIVRVNTTFVKLHFNLNLVIFYAHNYLTTANLPTFGSTVFPELFVPVA